MHTISTETFDHVLQLPSLISLSTYSQCGKNTFRLQPIFFCVFNREHRTFVFFPVLRAKTKEMQQDELFLMEQVS